MSKYNIAIQGIAGSNSHIALNNFAEFHDLEVSPHFTESFSEFVELMGKESELYFLVPHINSNGSFVHDGISGVINNELSVIAEELLPVRHFLVRNSSDTNEALEGRLVHSHPQAIRQCKKAIDEKGLTASEIGDTALAAKYLGEGKLEGFAIASRLTAEIYDNVELVEEIPLDKSNITRFLFCKQPGAETPESLVRAVSNYRFSVIVDGSPGERNLELANRFQEWGLRLVQTYSIPKENSENRTFSSQTVLDFVLGVENGYITYKGRGERIETGLPFKQFYDMVRETPTIQILGLYEMHRLNTHSQPFRSKAAPANGVLYALENQLPIHIRQYEAFCEKINLMKESAHPGLISSNQM